MLRQAAAPAMVENQVFCDRSRQFSRAFLGETGLSPAKAIENLRFEVARLMLEDSRHSMDVIAGEVGFGSRDRMRRAFVRKFGQAPREIRRDAHAA